MQKIILYISFLLLPISNTFSKGLNVPNSLIDYKELYSEMQLDSVVNFNAFEMAMKGYAKLKANTNNKDVITLIDFSKPSTEERFYVLDIKNRKLLMSSVVAHGKNSGQNYATSFSNVRGSNKSSLGFFITGNTYQGRNGYSLILNGLEKNINDKARERAIVIHGAEYSDPAIIASAGRLGRSQGCPALPHDLTQSAIDLIKDGTLLFIYADDATYRKTSKLVSGKHNS